MANDRIEQFFSHSQYHMANISQKQPTFRRAIAQGSISMNPEAFEAVENATLPKGDVLKLAEIAGVQGAKSAATLIPMCHPLPLDHVAIYPVINPETHEVWVYGTVSTTAKTGVEMEALAAVNAALLTLYDLIKPVDPALAIGNVRLLLKEGGKKGLWIHPEGIPESLQAVLPQHNHAPLSGISCAVITLSDRASQGIYEDKSGKLLQNMLTDLGAEVKDYALLPDDQKLLGQKLKCLTNKVDLVLTTGGTGIAERDVTPDTVMSLADRVIPGIGECLRAYGAQHIAMSWLSRSVAALMGGTLVVTLPGSQGGVKDGVTALKDFLPHAIGLIRPMQQPQTEEHQAEAEPA